MSTGPWHYREAERLLAPGVYDEAGEEDLVLRDLVAALGHAFLALAAATAEGSALSYKTSAGTSVWYRVLHGEEDES
jgi:hypothetical protein